MRKKLRYSGTMIHNAKARRKNPLRMDPTRTGMIRRAFIKDLKRRFKKLRKDVWEFLVTLDALGLKEKKQLTFNAQARQYQFLTDADKVRAFREWLIQQIDAGLLALPAGYAGDPTKPWMSPYIVSGYKKGLSAAYAKTPSNKAALLAGTTTQADFVRTAFNQPETTRKVELLATRAFEGMRGITGQVSSKLGQILAQGMADGRGVLDIARDIDAAIDTGMSRALTIARTEIISAHAEGSLDGYEALGVKELGVDVEFSTAGDDDVCPECEGMEGDVYTVDEARGVIPVHPNCRCAWIPYLDV